MAFRSPPYLALLLASALAPAFHQPALAQQFAFNYFTPIQSAGPLPGYFNLSLTEQQESFKRLLEPGKEEKAQKLVLSRINRGNYSILSKFNSGEILFGDRLTSYVNGVGAKIIKNNPTLPKDLQFFVTRSPNVNAGTYAMGIILVNVGLIAQVSSEAELAAVLCHEIAHYTMRHNVLSGYDVFDESQKKKARRQNYGEYLQEKVDRQYNRSKQHELEADSAGLLLYKNTGYEGQAALSLFTMLHGSDNSYGTFPVTLDAFTLNEVKFPPNFWLEEVKISASFLEHSDRYYTHPNAGVRLSCASRLSEKLGIKQGGPKYQTVQASEFSEIQDAARFEQLRLQLVGRQYGDVIYNAYFLSQKYPSNKYLDICTAKAFYGLARYKNADVYSDVARSYTQVEGESQRVHYLLKQFTRKQLNVYALKLVINTLKKYPKERFLDSLKSDLVRDLVVVNELKLNAFENGSADFHVALLAADVKDPALRKLFQENYPLLEKKKQDDIKSVSDRDKELLAKKKALRQNGPGINARKVLVESPYVAQTDKDGELLPEESELLRSNVMSALQNCAAKSNLSCSSLRGEVNDAASYNRIALLNECVRELVAHGDHDFRPVVADFVWPMADTYQTPLLYFTSCRYDQFTRKHQYSSALYNLLSCRVVHNRYEQESGEPSLKALQSFIQEDFEIIKR